MVHIDGKGSLIKYIDIVKSNKFQNLRRPDKYFFFYHNWIESIIRIKYSYIIVVDKLITASQN